ncbi:MAG: hypothetical protein HRU09_14470 [Oligoflexales bacterium]|nr:hypothetical protein [Oligoflexales bacterium]
MNHLFAKKTTEVRIGKVNYQIQFRHTFSQSVLQLRGDEVWPANERLSMKFMAYGKVFKVSKNKEPGWWEIVEQCPYPFSILRFAETAEEAFQNFIKDYRSEYKAIHHFNL